MRAGVGGLLVVAGPVALRGYEERLAAQALVAIRALFGLDAVNGWPGGSRMVECLRCGVTFSSTSKENRVCDTCRDINNRITEGDLLEHSNRNRYGTSYKEAQPSEWILSD